MKFATKLAVALWVGICVIYGVNAYDRYRREANLFEQDMRRDHSVMGRALAAAVAEVWAEEGRERALRLIARANQREGDVTIQWVDQIDLATGVPRDMAPAGAEEELRGGRPVTWVDRAGEGRVVSYVPILLDDDWVGGIQLSEPLADERAYLRTTLGRMAMTSSALALMAGGIAMGLGIWFVGRPIRMLADKARRVGAGDFSGRLELHQEDELGELAREMNAMSERLEAARVRVEAETRARLEADEQLRHGERLITVGKLASGVAHELGTPLNVIAQRAKMIASGEVADDAARDNARIVAEQAERISRIVRQLLDFARRRTPAKAPTDLAGVAERSAALLAPLARKRGVAVHVETDGPLRVEADPVQVEQVVANLVLNAIQALSAGGSLTVAVGSVVREPPPGVAPGCGCWATVEVRDDGPGIQPEHLSRVFDPFFTTKDVGEGTGLGLSVAYGIVRDHGGWIAVESVPGAGARFTVHLPKESSACAAAS